MSRRKHKRASDRVMLKWVRCQYGMPLHEWAKRFLQPVTRRATTFP